MGENAKEKNNKLNGKTGVTSTTITSKVMSKISATIYYVRYSYSFKSFKLIVKNFTRQYFPRKYSFSLY